MHLKLFHETMNLARMCPFSFVVHKTVITQNSKSAHGHSSTAKPATKEPLRLEASVQIAFLTALLAAL